MTSLARFAIGSPKYTLTVWIFRVTSKTSPRLRCDVNETEKRAVTTRLQNINSLPSDDVISSLALLVPQNSSGGFSISFSIISILSCRILNLFSSCFSFISDTSSSFGMTDNTESECLRFPLSGGFDLPNDKQTHYKDNHNTK